jgi:ABC-type transporter Mla subunit MlaD
MAREHYEFKVGLTVAVVLVLFVAVLAFIGQWDSLFAKTHTIHVRFDHTDGVQNLRAKDPIRVGGVNVGRVTRIWLSTDPVTRNGRSMNELYVHVLGEIPENIILYEDAQISVGAKIVGEGGTLEVLDTGHMGKVLTKDHVVEGVPPANFTEMAVRVSHELDANDPNSLLSQIKTQLDPMNAKSILSKVHRTMDDLNAISAVVRTQLNADEQASLLSKVQKAMDNINATTAALRSEMDKSDSAAAIVRIHQVLDNLNASMVSARKMLEVSQPKIISTVTHVENTAKRIDEDISVKLSKELDKNESGSLVAQLHSSLTSAQAGMDNLKVMTQTGKDVLVLNRDNLQAVIDNFTETSAQLKATSKEVRRNPWRLLYKPDENERSYANLLESARAFSDAAGALDQANNNMKTLVQMNPQGLDPNDPQMRVIREQVQKAFCDFEQAQKKLWEMLQKQTP